MTDRPTQVRKPNWPANLTLRNGRFYVQVRVPESLRGVVTTGRGTHIRQSLRTRNEAEAIRRHRMVEAEIKGRIELARREPDGSRKGADAAAPDVAASAAWWREHLKGLGTRPADAWDDLGFSLTVEELRGEPTGTQVTHDGRERTLYDPAHEARASELVDLVTGQRIPVATELERFLGDKRGARGGPIGTRYASRIRLSVRNLAAWLTSRAGDNVGSVTRYEAGLYSEHLAATCNTVQTAATRVTALSSYWTWLVKRGAATENPWRDQAPERRSSPNDARKRPYTDDEVKGLLAGETYSTLHDMMRIAALSGMRINEIGRLTVGDCTGRLFDIREAKTSAGVRRVPIHPALSAIITRRSLAKSDAEFLIEELSARKDHTGDRAAKASERFTAYRRSLDMDEKTAKQRQSNIDFHSFRRWFATKAEQAGQPPHVISAVVGHREGRQGMTLGTYSGGPSEQQMREVVESVRLPEGTPADKPEGARMGDGRWPQRARKSSASK